MERARRDGKSVSAVHLRHLNPFPRNLGEIMGRFDQILVPEMNLGQLAMLLKARYLQAGDLPDQGARPALQDQRNQRQDRRAAGLARRNPISSEKSSTS